MSTVRLLPTLAKTVGAWRLRVAHVYRREDGEWKFVHRHGDIPPEDQSPG